MNPADPLGIQPERPRPIAIQPIEYVVIQHALDRILAFTGWSIDDVVNNPIARNEVFGYYKLHREVQRTCETVDLERQWNPVGRRV